MTSLHWKDEETTIFIARSFIGNWNPTFIKYGIRDQNAQSKFQPKIGNLPKYSEPKEALTIMKGHVEDTHIKKMKKPHNLYKMHELLLSYFIIKIITIIMS